MRVQLHALGAGRVQCTLSSEESAAPAQWMNAVRRALLHWVPCWALHVSGTNAVVYANDTSVSDEELLHALHMTAITERGPALLEALRAPPAPVPVLLHFAATDPQALVQDGRALQCSVHQTAVTAGALCVVRGSKCGTTTPCLEALHPGNTLAVLDRSGCVAVSCVARWGCAEQLGPAHAAVTGCTALLSSPPAVPVTTVHCESVSGMPSTWALLWALAGLAASLDSVREGLEAVHAAAVTALGDNTVTAPKGHSVPVQCEGSAASLPVIAQGVWDACSAAEHAVSPPHKPLTASHHNAMEPVVGAGRCLQCGRPLGHMYSLLHDAARTRALHLCLEHLGMNSSDGTVACCRAQLMGTLRAESAAEPLHWRGPRRAVCSLTKGGLAQRKASACEHYCVSQADHPVDLMHAALQAQKQCRSTPSSVGMQHG